MSPAARRRIVAAQKARWAKWRKAQKIGAAAGVRNDTVFYPRRAPIRCLRRDNNPDNE